MIIPTNIPESESGYVSRFFYRDKEITVGQYLWLLEVEGIDYWDCEIRLFEGEIRIQLMESRQFDLD